MPGTIIELFTDAVRAGGDRTAFVHRIGDSWHELSFADAQERVEAIGAGLIDLGVRPGDRVAIIAATRLEWSLCDYAALGAGAVVVPVYQTNSAGEVCHVLRDSGCTVAIVEDAAQLHKLQRVRESLPELRDVVVIEPGSTAVDGDNGGGAITLAELEGRGARAGADGWRAACGTIDTHDLATLIYTSGTTGPPKGCMLSHCNYVEMTKMVTSDEIGVFQQDDRVALFLPLAHTFARLTQFACTDARAQLAFTTATTLIDDIQQLRPTLLPGVPRVFEKAHSRVLGQFEAATGAKAHLISWAMRTGSLRSRYVEHGRRVPPLLAANYKLATKLVFSKIHERFGGRIRLFISGGAPLSREVQEFLFAAGMTVLEGYGLSECTTACTLNRPHRFRLGSVGPALPRSELRIADDGEILIRGPHVFQGYFGNEEATREVMLDDGWLRSGDLGTLDKDGFLYISGRKKDIIVTAGGKNVSPQNIENALKATRFISEALVFGDARPYLTALVTLDGAELQALAEEHGLPTDPDSIITHERVQLLVREALDQVNSEHGRTDQVRRLRVLPVDFAQETGELTPTLKLKRNLVAERYGRYIDEMYEPDAPEVAVITDPQVHELQPAHGS